MSDTSTRSTPENEAPGTPAGPDGGPPSRLAALGRSVARRRLPVLLLTLVVMALAAVFGGGVAERLSSGGFTDPKSESTKAERVLADRFRTGVPNLVLLARAPGSVDDPEAAAAGRALTERVAKAPGVLSTGSYWTMPGAAPLRSKDGRSALVLVRLGGSEDDFRATAKRLVPQVRGEQGVLDVTVTGSAQVSVEIEKRSEQDLAKAEAITAPATLLILLMVFGSAVAASLPLAVGLLSVLGTFLVLRLLSMVVSVSVFATNITTALGLGLAIDYSLFIVTRYREELASGKDVPEAIAETVRTAGRTVLFSAVTVALSLAGLLVFPLYFLRSFAYAGMAVVALAALGAVLVLPALLALLGRRVDAWNVHRLLRRGRERRPAGQAGGETGFWHRLATAVMRRPALFALAVVVLLVSLGLPFTRASFGITDDRELPASAPAHVAAQVVRDDFDSRENSALSVVLPTTSADRVRAYAARASTLPGVSRVDAATGSYAGGKQVAGAGPASARFRAPGATWMSVVPSVEPYSDAGARLVERLRAAEGAPGRLLVGGQAALLVDTRDALAAGLPWTGLIIAGATLVLLFLFTGSLLIPVEAVVFNLLSLSATFGAMVYVFQEGHLRWLVGDFSVTGLLDISMPVLMFCVVFGLSMDYEVFLLSRIREVYVATGDNTRAVALGLERTGRLVSAAALLFATVMAAFATSGLTILKLLGVGLASAVIVDATVVRGLLVPSVMRLAGRANWWAPRPLRRLHERLGLKEA
ncbi:MMPL family transporter [Streptomyces alanosinicus]|uniref:Membrane protein n=1 Tax=Streptomyces alanosinicus TaxID=68171 RepID=A0A919D776_9ACTN|nr:MMPL family transporter [Streptomyces alanosinicus]GHE10251.1 membrane protein [Streptomyces alanosinicus]